MIDSTETTALPAVTLLNLERRFGDFITVNRVTMAVRQGEIIGFLGPNGAGKSTTIRMLCGIRPPTGGSGAVASFDMVRDAEAIKQHIGYTSQKFSLYEDLTVEEYIDFYRGELIALGTPRELKEAQGQPTWRKYITLIEARDQLDGAQNAVQA